MKAAPLLLALGLALLAPLAALAQRTTLTDALKAAVLRADETRLYAQLAGDTAALDDMLAPDCLYVHSNGAVQTKAQLLQTLKSGALKYLALRYDAPPQIRLYGNETGILQARAQVAIQLADGQTRKLSLQVTAVYVLLHDRWQLASYQSTDAPSAPAAK